MKYKAYKYLLENGETFTDIITWLNNFALKKHNRGLSLRNADLFNADLRKAELSYADFCNANLSYANLSYADLGYADLSYANLRHANLRGSNLRKAALSYTDLRDACLEYAALPLQCTTKEITIDEDNLKFLLKIVFSSKCDWEFFKKFKKGNDCKKLIGEIE